MKVLCESNKKIRRSRFQIFLNLGFEPQIIFKYFTLILNYTNSLNKKQI